MQPILDYIVYPLKGIPIRDQGTVDVSFQNVRIDINLDFFETLKNRMDLVTREVQVAISNFEETEQEKIGCFDRWSEDAVHFLAYLQCSYEG